VKVGVKAGVHNTIHTALPRWAEAKAASGVVHDMYDTASLAMLHHALTTEGQAAADAHSAKAVVCAAHAARRALHHHPWALPTTRLTWQVLPMCVAIERAERAARDGGVVGQADAFDALAPVSASDRQRALRQLVDKMYEGRWRCFEGWDAPTSPGKTTSSGPY
jgi:hypothetical protein